MRGSVFGRKWVLWWRFSLRWRVVERWFWLIASCVSVNLRVGASESSGAILVVVGEALNFWRSPWFQCANHHEIAIWLAKHCS